MSEVWYKAACRGENSLPLWKKQLYVQGRVLYGRPYSWWIPRRRKDNGFPNWPKVQCSPQKIAGGRRRIEQNKCCFHSWSQGGLGGKVPGLWLCSTRAQWHYSSDEIYFSTGPAETQTSLSAQVIWDAALAKWKSLKILLIVLYDQITASHAQLLKLAEHVGVFQQEKTNSSVISLILSSSNQNHNRI